MCLKQNVLLGRAAWEHAGIVADEDEDEDEEAAAAGGLSVVANWHFAGASGRSFRLRRSGVAADRRSVPYLRMAASRRDSRVPERDGGNEATDDIEEDERVKGASPHMALAAKFQ